MTTIWTINTITLSKYTDEIKNVGVNFVSKFEIKLKCTCNVTNKSKDYFLQQVFSAYFETRVHGHNLLGEPARDNHVVYLSEFHFVTCVSSYTSIFSQTF